MEGLRKHMLLLITLSILLVIFLLFYSYDTSLNTFILIDFQKQNVTAKALETDTNQSDLEPYVFSKMKFYNKTHTVNFFRLKLLASYFYFIILAL